MARLNLAMLLLMSVWPISNYRSKMWLKKVHMSILLRPSLGSSSNA